MPYNSLAYCTGRVESTEGKPNLYGYEYDIEGLSKDVEHNYLGE